MTGPRGPVPKREDQRRRRNAGHKPQTVNTFSGITAQPPLRPGLNPLAARWYSALAESGQSQFYEASDWMTAQLIAEAIDEFCDSRKASMLPSILAGASSLLATEGDRRRLRIELVRQAGDPDEDAAVAAVDDYRIRLAT